jgi:hypothetical protein
MEYRGDNPNIMDAVLYIQIDNMSYELQQQFGQFQN